MPQHDEMLFAGVDIGTSTVRVAVGIRGEKSGDGVHIIGAAEVPSMGVQRGTIKSIEDAISAVSTCIEKVDRMTGIPLQNTWVAMSGVGSGLLESRGLISVSKQDGEIREDDMIRAIENAQSTATLPSNAELVHVIAKSFVIDGASGVKDPIGMTGHRLEVEAQIIHGSTPHIRNLMRTLYRTGVNVDRPVLGILASGEAVLTHQQKDLGVCIVDIGAATTDIAVFENGDIVHIATIPMGSMSITADIAVVLKTQILVAERIKLAAVDAVYDRVSKKEEINLRDFGAEEDDVISRRLVCEVASARLEEILDEIQKELKKVGLNGKLPAGVVFTGAGSNLNGLIPFAKEKLELPALLGLPISATSVPDRLTDLGFTTAIGLVQWAVRESPEQSSQHLSAFQKPIEGVKGAVKKLFSALVP